MIRGEKVCGRMSTTQSGYLDTALTDIRRILQAGGYLSNYILRGTETELVLQPRLKNDRGIYVHIDLQNDFEEVIPVNLKTIPVKYAKGLVRALKLSKDAIYNSTQGKKLIFNAGKTECGYVLADGYYLEAKAEKNGSVETKSQQIDAEPTFPVRISRNGEVVNTIQTTISRFYHDISKAIIYLDPNCKVKVDAGRYGQGLYTYVLKGKVSTAPRFMKCEYSNYNVPIQKEPKRYLKCLDQKYNHYKFYNIWHDDGQTKVEYGRIGDEENPQYGRSTYQYKMDMYWIKYYEKVAKGYSDFTAQETDTQSVNDRTDRKAKKYPNKAYEELYTYLESQTNCFLHGTVTDSVRQRVTIKDIVTARKMLTVLAKTTEVEKFNEVLTKLLLLIPRKTEQIGQLLAQTPEDFAGILDREEGLLKALEPTILAEQPKDVDTKIDNPLHCKITEATPEEYHKIESMMTNRAKSHGYTVEKVYRVEGCKGSRTFNPNGLTTKLLWHGSRTEHWISILQNGLKISPKSRHITRSGSLFGDGLYFAPDIMKSIGYTSHSGAYWTGGDSSRGILALCEVATGNQWEIDEALDYTAKLVEKNGYNSVYAKGGKQLKWYGSLWNDEVIVYRENQAVVRYIVVVK